MIKDRRHHLRTYPNCFVAKELIDWLIEHKEAMDRETAIKIMQKLLDQSIVHHGELAPRCFPPRRRGGVFLDLLGIFREGAAPPRVSGPGRLQPTCYQTLTFAPPFFMPVAAVIAVATVSLVHVGENPTNPRPLLTCVFLVCDEHRDFKDMKLFYRFRKDDGTFPLDSEAKVFMRGQRIYEKYDHAQMHHATLFIYIISIYYYLLCDSEKFIVGATIIFLFENILINEHRKRNEVNTLFILQNNQTKKRLTFSSTYPTTCLAQVNLLAQVSPPDTHTHTRTHTHICCIRGRRNTVQGSHLSF